MNTSREKETRRRPPIKSTHRAYRPDDECNIDYRDALMKLIPDVKDEKLIRRVWRLLIVSYNEQ